MAAQNGVALLIGRSGARFSISFYCDDTAGNPVRFSTAGKAGAGSPTEYQPSEACILADWCMAAASGQTTTQIVRAGTPTGDIILNANHLASVTNRPGLSIPFTPGLKLGAYQLA